MATDPVVERLRALPESRRALLELLRKGKPAAPDGAGTMRRRGSGGPYPLSFGQQRLCIAEQLAPGSSVYNVPLALHVDGDLNTAVLERTLNCILARHESLRTKIVADRQVVSPEITVALKVEDLSGQPDPKSSMHARVDEEALVPFDIVAGPLVRVRLLRLEARRHVLLITMHHLVSDGWSIGVLLREMGAIYPALLRGEPLPLAELPIQYGDYAEWQRESLQGETLKTLLAYWRSRLNGLATLQLLPDRPRRPVSTFRGNGVGRLLSPGLTERLKEYGRDRGASLFMTLLAGFNALLSRYAGQDDIVVGSPIANRTRPELDPLIGFLVNSLVLRTDLSGQPTFDDLLARVRETTLGAYAHQELPFERLVEEIQPERDLSRNPLFQVAFVMQDAGWPAVQMGEVKIRPVESVAAVTRFDLELHVAEVQGGLRVWMQYNTDMWTSETAARMLSHWEQLLTAAVAEPERPVSELPLVEESEQRRLLLDWNRTATACPGDQVLTGLFEEQARRAPASIAVEFASESLTYSELNVRANQLAHYLRARGVGPDSFVGVCVERSIEMVVAVLGVIKAGGAYVPLDSNYPAKRLEFMLSDSGTSIVLTQQRLLDQLATASAALICLDRDWRDIAACPDTDPPIEAMPANLAYVMYTSGSTGEPKGVAVPQRAVVRLVKGTDYAQLQADDVVAQASNFSFDAATFEIWGALLNGARLVGISKDVVLSPAEFATQLDSHGITTLFLTTALFNELARQKPHCFRRLRHMLFGGEAVDVRWVRTVLSQGPPRRLLHVYGPTECTTFSTWQLVEQVPEDAATIPIGRPIANTTAYVLDRHSQPVPVGIPGELYLGGDGLARGYWGRPELTAERFVANPYGEGLLYRTGDLVRRQESGAIEFLGRIDHQVKIRGFRVEPGEVESLLVRNDAVRNAAVMVREDTPGEKRMVAYVVASDAQEGLRSRLRAYLAEQLPSYMMPAAFVLMPALPLNENGKVDRAALPVPDHDQLTEQEYAPPSTPSEELLAGIWMDLLKASRIGVHENFFELGGHSLLATQLISRIRTVFSIDLPLRSVFETPTIASLASAIEALQGSGAMSTTEIVSRRYSDGTRLLSFGQQRLCIAEKLAPGSPMYNVPLSLRIEGDLDTSILFRTLNCIVARHESLRTTIAGDRQRVAPEHDVTLEVEDLSHFADPNRQMLARLAEEATAPFDITNGPLARFRLLRLAAAEHVLHITMHHLISDGWSIGVLLREMGAIYPAFLNAEPSPLPELRIQYGDYAEWQRESLQGDTLDRLLDYWRERLSGLPTLQLLPDRPRRPVSTFRGAGAGRLLSPDLTARLKTFGRERGATLFMTLLAGFTTLLSRYAGQDDIVVGSPIANRTRAELEPLIGFLVNSLVLRTDLSGRPSFAGVLARVRETTLGAFAHQDLPFEKLVEELQPERELSRNPLFQVAFAMQDASWPVVQMGPVQLNLVESTSAVTRFDLELHVADTSDGLRAWMQYNADMWNGETIERMLAHWEHLLTHAIAEPGRPISDLPLLSDSERRQILLDWNNTATEYPRTQSVVELVEHHAAIAPAALAVQRDAQSLSYADLNTRANRLAHYLRANGIQPESLVGVCLERSIDLIIAVLAVLKAGGAYVALDAGYPAKRLEFMLADAQAQLVLTHEHLLDRLSSSATPAFCLDRDWPSIETFPSTNPQLNLAPAHLAYLIYTSGSTGQPKGVAIEHHGLMNLIQWHQREYELTPADRATQLAGTGFDASVWEIWPYLAAGASLHIPDEETRAAPPLLLDWLRAQRITLTFLPTPLAEALLDLPGAATLPLRALLTGGDRLHRVWPGLGFRLMNHYGPTENSVVATWCEVNGDLTGPPPIGKPLDNVRVYVLDVNGQPVPVGVPGELCLAGESLARGYWQQPEPTAERFVVGAAVNERRLYRTGDSVRWRPDGHIEYLGRLDQQIKIRGFRIELGEIESALASHPSVTQAAVILHEDAAARRRLLAYVVPAPGVKPDPCALRAYLKEQLPEAFVPETILSIATLPLNRNGKLDRTALPIPDLSNDAIGSRPKSPIEELLANIWSDLLGVDDVGLRRDFFDIGGHSLLATQVQSHIRSVFGREIPLRAIFENRTIEDLAEAIGRETTLTGSHRIEPVARQRGLPLSSAQRRLWLLNQIQPDSVVYNVPLVLRIRGSLDSAALRHALQDIVNRHEILRTTFHLHDGAPSQIIAESSNVELSELDLSHLPSDEQSAAIDQAARADGARRFDLERGPLFRPALLRLSSTDNVLIIAMHHIVVDGWSIPVMIREICDFYTASLTGILPQAAALPIQYADFAVWQGHQLESGALNGQLEYWRQQLAGDLPVLELPADHPRPIVQTFRGASLARQLSPALLAGLKELGRNDGTTLFMTLLAAFQVLLHRYTGQEDIVLGSPVANRNRHELEGLVGFFVNTLVLRTDLSGRPTFRELLRRVREVTLAAYAHQDVPFEKLVDALRPERRVSHTPLFQHMFVLQNMGATSLESAGLYFEAMEFESGVAKFDLVLGAVEQDGALTAGFNYNTDLFEASTIERMLSHWEHLLTAAIAEPDRHIADLPLLSDSERRQILLDWNDTASESPRTLSIIELIEHHAAIAPDSLAVQCGTQSLSYADLNARANRLAHHLRANGVQPETLVGVCLERSIDLIVAVLAVLKSGGAYVALDANYPAKRLEVMLADAQAQLVLTHEHLLDRLSSSALPAFCLDRDWPSIDNLPTTNPDLQLTPANLAYLIYTSGSTGQPKGVAIEHHGLMNLVQWHQREYQLTPADRATQLAGTGFDASVWEIWPYLAAGASLHIPDEETRAAPPILLDWLRAQHITLTFLPTPLAETLLDLPGAATLPLRALLTGGDRLHRAWPGLSFRLMNHYGPTENSVVATWCEVNGELNGPPPIGKPLDNVRVYVLNANGQPVPVGVPGELCIAGESLARGYWQQPELTAERFVDGAAVSEQRLYRTGDRVRWRPDGHLEFEGRIDQQVKLRGFRVEPGEIEAALASHASVREAVVVLSDNLPGPPRLIGYIAPPLAPEEMTRLRQFLAERLPDYMIPAPIIGLDSFPLNASGKVDRSALPVPEGRITSEAFSAPRNELESSIAHVWQDLLHLDAVGINDNLFDLGAHSLMLVDAKGKVETSTGRAVSVLDFFQFPTIAAMATHLARSVNGDSAATPDPTSLTELRHRSMQQRRALRQAIQ